jgi:hypothetical protein
MILTSEDSDRAVNLDRLAEEDLTPVLGPAKRFQRPSTDSFGSEIRIPNFFIDDWKGERQKRLRDVTQPPSH